MKTSTTGQPRVDLEEFSTDPSVARAVQERLAKLRARQARDGKYLIRQARQLRRKLMKEIQSFRSHSIRPTP